jgi:quercetin dioxygenase-like cupin family protein
MEGKMKKLKIVPKPWGQEIWFANEKKYVGKILIIKKGKRLSKQYHKKKHETIYCDKGKYIMEIYGKPRIVKEGEAIVVKPKTIHRMFAKFCDVKLLEVSTPEVWDVVRVEDDYGRKGK